MPPIKIRITAFSRGEVIGEKQLDPPDHIAGVLEGKTPAQMRDICDSMELEFNAALEKSLSESGLKIEDTPLKFKFDIVLDRQ